MENELRQLQAEVDAISVEDLHGVHELLIRCQKYSRSAKAAYRPVGYELSRRAERKMGLAFRRAQARGEMRIQGQAGNKVDALSAKSFVSAGRTLTEIYLLADGVTDEGFEEALNTCRVSGDLDRVSVIAALPPRQAVQPTKRGAKTVEHMAISLNAIASGVTEVDPGEVDTVQLANYLASIKNDLNWIKIWLRKVNK